MLPAHSRRYPMTDPEDGYLSSLRLSRYLSAGSIIGYRLSYTGSIWFCLYILKNDKAVHYPLDMGICLINPYQKVE